MSFTEPTIWTREDLATGDLVMTVRFDRREIDEVGAMVLATHISTIVDRCVDRLRDTIVERVQPEVLARIDVPSIINLATVRAGVRLGERLAEETTKGRKS